MIIAGRATCCRSARCPSTAPIPSARRSGRSATSRSEIPVWDEKICIQCGKCVLVCPHAVIRAKVYDAAAAERRAGHASSRRPPGGRIQGAALHAPGGAGGLHRLRAVRRGLPGQEQERDQAQGASTCGRSRRCASRRGANWDFFLDAARGGPHGRCVPTASRTSSCSSRCSSSRAPAAGCGETPYLKLLTPAVRRPGPRRQRHRLLVDLRRQPAHDAVGDEPRGPRPGLVQLAVRGQRRVRPGHAAGRWTSRRSTPASWCSALADRAGRRSWRPRCWAPTSPPRPASRRSASASVTLQGSCSRPCPIPRPATCSSRWPTRWSRRASGSWAATAGPTTSATAAWTTCWRRAAT